MTADDNYLKSELYSLVKSDSSIFDFLQEGSLDGLWYWDLENPEHEWFSPRFWTLLGYDPNEKKHLACEWQDLIFPEDLEIAIDNFNKHCADQKHPYDQVVRYRHKNGSTIWVRCRGLVIRNAKGTPVRMLGAHTDLTSQKLAEENLKESERKFRALFEQSGGYCMILDPQTSDGIPLIVDVNEAACIQHGYTREELIGRPVADIDDEDGKRLVRDRTIVIMKGKPFYCENVHVRKDGTTFPVSVHAQRIDLENGSTFILTTEYDITARKMVEESLQKVKEDLERKASELEDTNTALSVLLQKRDLDSLEMQESIFSNYELMIEPFLKKLKNTVSDKKQQNLIDIIEINLKEVVSPFIKKLSDPMMSLTQTEIQIAAMIKQGFTNKEIAQTLNCSKRTVDTHRENIRKKLDLTNKKINLKSFLINS